MDELGVAVVIEDDADVRNLLEGVLTQAGFEVHTAVDGRAGVEVVRSKQANVVTLDIGLPDIDGFEVLRRIRHFSNAYVVMLTGRTEEPDLLSALNAGADDYIAKPFRPRELRARVAAMMRRPRHEINGQRPAPAWGAPATAAAAPGSHDSAVLQHNGLTLNHRTRTVEIKGEPLGLTRSEFDLLHVLLRGGGAVCTRADLVRAVRGEFYEHDTYISEADERAVEVHVGNLRRKLKEDQLSPRWLQTVRGVGYRLAPSRPFEE
ncbi:response regulator transcription factor [Arthrobacter sp. KFRI-F3372]|jgi:DNA-binding response OmpR family regulator|uniref:DNA-binding response OmpR family regulator n=1 Tax=Pseudarthrobacter oxydans TaxID=1671 RepID=A0AAW8N3K5_PSEOX|nr:response regulator transcription factor [Pseudarthrobacter oxydans]MDR6791228.1 DNA-binding response OmpR family regulator [Pseudarthrobacter oxydans]MDR7162343.1 DNA-binding response OmpR family regulator [Pseudarthrobacter oxydans]MDV2977138.1 response regulator transcription factor [Actinomycetes bacterium ARC8]WHP58183.1 response regulator transcription factor [Arthrobacter sp. KFRI-F3372]